MRALIALATLSVGCSKLLGITDPSVGGGGDARDDGSLPGDDTPDSSFDAPPACTTAPVFGAEATYTLAAPGTGLGFGNLDADTPGATRDVAIAIGTEIAVLHNDGTGVLGTPTSIATPADGVIVDDFTLDGRVDIIAWKLGGTSVVERQHDTVTRGDYLAEQPLPGPFTGVVTVKVGFLDGAFNPDLLVHDASERRVYTSNLGTLGTFSKEEEVGTAGDDLVLVNDLDALSNDDAAFVDQTGAVKVSLSSGSLGATATIATGARPLAVAFGKFDDGNSLDAIVGTASGGVIYTQATAGTWTEQPGSVFGVTEAMTVLDVNGDTTDDLVLGNGILLQCPTTHVFTQFTPLTITSPYALVDLTKDGKPDLVRVDGASLKVRIQQ